MNASSNQQIPNSDIWSRIGLDRNKCIAIVSLSLVLIVVLVVQFGGGSSQQPAPVAKKTAFKDSAKPTTGKSERSVIRKKLAKAKKVAEANRTSEANRTAKKTAGSSTKAKQPSKSKSASSHSDGSKKAWPKVDMTKLKLENPFGPPAELERMKKEKEEKARQEKLKKEKLEKERAEGEKKARIQQAIRNFQQQGVRLVFIKDNQRVAQIGSRIVKPGDVVEGIKIIEIKDNGSIVFEVVDSFFESLQKAKKTK